MGKKWWISGTVCAAIVLASCGGAGGGDFAGGGAQGEVGELRLLGHEPLTDALQVDVESEVTLRFDGAIDPAALVDQELRLCVAGETTPVAGTFRTSNGGRTVHFKPLAELQAATTYRFEVEPTLCDQSYRTLDDDPSFEFRTTDLVAPVVVATSIADRQVDVDRTAPVAFEFDEDLDPVSLRQGSIVLRDEWGSEFPLELSYANKVVLAQCLHDLPGNRRLVMTLRAGNGALRDRSGNEVAVATTLRFTTRNDATAPSLTASFPAASATLVSPRCRIELRFDEAMDRDSYEPSSLRLIDDFENSVPISVTLSEDLRTVRLTPELPLRLNDRYRVQASVGATALADVSGNQIQAAIDFSFETGHDADAPNVVRSHPLDNETSVPIDVPLEVEFDEALDPGSVHRKTVRLFAGDVPQVVTLSSSGPSTTSATARIRIQPVEPLPLAVPCRLEVLGGPEGVRDVNGNPLEATHTLHFVTTSSAVRPTLVITPQDGATGVPVTSRIVIVSNTKLRPETVNDDTIIVTNGLTTRVAGTIAVVRSGRGIVFEPTYALPSIAILRLRIVGGLRGVRSVDGGALTDDIDADFRTGGHADTLEPSIDITLNDVAASRREGLAVPPQGFTIDIKAYDLGSLTVDPATLELALTGPAQTPSADELFAITTFAGNLRARTLIGSEHALANGSYTLTARVKDTTGNESRAATLSFEVDSATEARRPFERTQLVWVRFDTDREGGGRGDGRADFEEDLRDFGLIADGDPIGSNAKMIALVRDGALRVANRLFHRGPTSARIDEDSIRVRLVARQPCGAPHMRMAVGGLDPTGSPTRKFGEDSTGVLGRALFDYRNAVLNENNTGTNPGLGVFIGELFLFQSRLYLDLYPHYVTRFGRTYRELSPHMEGTPAGTHALDSKVLADDFDYALATANERQRWDAIHVAADHLSRAIGVILTHEIGHSIGLVPTGLPSSGLHGDRSLHNSSSGIEDVMSAILGYESLTTIDFEFRPLNLAYLRERVLLK